MKSKDASKIIFCASMSILLIGCGLHRKNPTDPLEAYNRKMFVFNTDVDNYIFKPIARQYRAMVPPLAREGVTNFFSNIDEVRTTVNDVLQFEMGLAVCATWRFAINSTFGIGGLFDVAGKIGMKKHSNDLGITLAKWGDVNSPYFIVPFYGPSTIRDAFGYSFDYAVFSPYPYAAKYIGGQWVSYSIFLFGKLNSRANFIDSEDLIDALTFDAYVFQRDAYLQYRNAAINGGDAVDPYVGPDDKPKS